MFLRKIRKRLLNENNFSKLASPASKYFIYAIGEIILVVIGILIALQINNWNEERKQQKTINSIYSIIKNDLISDVEIFSSLINIISSKDSIFKRIISKKMTIEDYQNCQNCIHLLAGFADVKIEKRGLNLLSDNSTLFSSQEDSLYIKISKFYKYYDTEFAVTQKELTENHTENWFYWKNNKPWFSSYFNANQTDEMIDYMVNSWDYINRVTATYFLEHHLRLNQLKGYKRDALGIIEEIDKRLE